MVRMLAVASGSRGMAGGQQVDFDSTGKQLSVPELESMHIRKTGALIRAAVMLGAACGFPLSARTSRASRAVRKLHRARVPGRRRRARRR
jgi:geranylgeranyl pyrophosphate synthase